MKNDDAFYETLLDNLYDGVYFVDKDRSVTYWNKGAEQITGYTSSEVLGKRCSDNILVHVDRQGTPMCTGICPLAETISKGIEGNQEIYLRHKNGHRVPVIVRVAPIRNDQGEIVGGVEIFTDNIPPSSALERLAELERMAFLDTLTNLANRRYAEINLNARLEEMGRYGWRFGVLFVDIDRFKNINDRHGHNVGDEVLKMVAKTLQNSMRSFDVVSRWGGEEYVIVIANVEGGELVATANRSRALVEQSRVPSVPSLRITVSIGATIAQENDTVESIIKRADTLMYRSKQTGRNRISADK